MSTLPIINNFVNNLYVIKYIGNDANELSYDAKNC